MSKEPIFVVDGETLVVIAKTPGPTVSDPADTYPYLSQAYRVVADRTGHTLVLVPLSATSTRVSQNEIDQRRARLQDEIKKFFTEENFEKSLA